MDTGMRTSVGAAVLSSLVLLAVHGEVRAAQPGDIFSGELPSGAIFRALGVELTLGGGVVGFVDRDTRDLADVGGAWSFRAALGSKQYLTLELAYVGTLGGLDVDGLDPDAALLGGAIEATGRLNAVAVGPWQPYLIAGVGWQHYGIVNDGFDRSAVDRDINAAVFPLGVGLAFKTGVTGLMVGIRSMLRLTAGDALIEGEAVAGDALLHTLSGSLRVGWQF